MYLERQDSNGLGEIHKVVILHFNNRLGKTCTTLGHCDKHPVYQLST